MVKTAPSKGLHARIMWTLSGFTDEIDPRLRHPVPGRLRPRAEVHRDQECVADQHPRPRRATSSPTVQQTLAEYGLQVSSIGSPIGKIKITDDFAPHLDRMRHAAEVAKQLNAPYLRLFSFFIPAGEDPDDYRDEVLVPASGDRRGRRAGRRDRRAREREGDLRRHPAPLPRHRHLGRLAESQAGLGSGQLRPVRREAVHRGLRDPAPAHRLHPDQGRAVRRLLGGGGRGGRR